MAKKKVSAYICIFLGEMQRGTGAEVTIVTDVKGILKWIVGAYGTPFKNLEITDNKLTGELQADDEHVLSLKLDFDNKKTFIKLEEDIDVILCPDGRPWATEMYPIYEDEPLKAGNIFRETV